MCDQTVRCCRAQPHTLLGLTLAGFPYSLRASLVRPGDQEQVIKGGLFPYRQNDRSRPAETDYAVFIEAMEKLP